MPDDPTARARFYRTAELNKSKSEEFGRPIYDDYERVEIITPGDKHTIFHNNVADCHRERWPDNYAAFKRGEQQAVTGTPLEHWPNAALTTARVAELKAIFIFSVEDLAQVPDNTLDRLGMGGRALRDAARTYIEAAKGNAPNAEMAAHMAEQKERIERLEALLQDRPAPKKPAKPSKAVEAPTDKALADCTDAELRAYIKRETGKPAAGFLKRDKLMERATELATAHTDPF